MKILLYTYDIMKIGGIETSFYNLAQYLKDKGHEVGVRYTVIAPMQMKRYKDAGIDIKKQEQEVCDLLLIGSIFNQPKLIIAKLTVQQIHADWTDEFWKGAGSARQMVNKADANVDMYACVSDSSCNFISRLTEKPIITMNNLAPAKSDVKRSKHDKKVFAAFTRMSAEKGLENYQVLRDKIISLGIDAEFRVYTNGNAPDDWELYEPVPDIKKVFNDIDFVCSLADTESFGYTIAEANSAGVPCIVKRANSTAEFFDNESNVILDNMNDLTVKDLTRTIIAYNLREQTEKSIDKALEYFDKEQKRKCIIKCKRKFYDIEAQKSRIMGSYFAVSPKRAKELLKNKYNIVEEL